MKLEILAIGKIKPQSPENILFEHYKHRISPPWQLTVKEFEAKKTLLPPQKQKEEASLLLSAINEKSYKIALDERGKMLTSPEFADLISRLNLEGYSLINFIIGGADGLKKDVLEKSNLTLSLGKMVWPHFLVRGILAEQIYRAKTILDGHPYHRE